MRMLGRVERHEFDRLQELASGLRIITWFLAVHPLAFEDEQNAT